MAINKVIYGNTVLIDLTADTVTDEQILTGFTAHDASGNVIVGTCDFDVNSGDADVKVSEILEGKTAYARGAKLTGIMPNNEGADYVISTVDDEITIAQGYHDGSGKASILPTEKAKLIAANIKQGVTILGVEGSLEPSSEVKVQSKNVTPKTTSQTVLPDEGIDYLAQVDVAAIPYTEVMNPVGGYTVIIAGE